jgi:hypothetical protein
MKNSSETIGNPTRDLPACNAVPQPTALPRACYAIWPKKVIFQNGSFFFNITAWQTEGK